VGYEQSGRFIRRTGWTLEGTMAVARSHHNDQFREVAEKPTRHRALQVVGVAVTVLIVTAGAARTALASQKPSTIQYTATATCAQISETGSTLEIVCAGSSSVDGDGAAVATITLNGTSGTATSVGYFADGVRRSKETFTVARDASGTTTTPTGSGTCTGGTGIYRHARCSYALTGTTNSKSNVSSSKEVGTVTR
jgi:hypothetical protein